MEAVGFVELLAAPAAKRRWSDEAKGRMFAETLVSGVTGLFRTNPVRDSSRKSNVVAGGHEQTPPLLQDQELAVLQRSAQASGVADDLVRSRQDPGSRTDRQTGPTAGLPAMFH